MNVLVACEESQRVCAAFREKGHNAFSCDILPCSGGHPEWHIMDDVLDILNPFEHSDPSKTVMGISFCTMDARYHFFEGKWDLIIAHPPCTKLSNAGARWLFAGGKLNQQRYEDGLKAKEFFMAFYNADCERICIENPTPSSIYNLPPHAQTVQPYEHGEPWSKKTLLWLKNLNPLRPTNIVAEHKPYCTSGSYSRNHDKKYRGASRKGGSSKSRSKTFWGIARAMADQWG
jgi:hypothetical protein